jgi:uncharacterized membrane protein
VDEHSKTLIRTKSSMRLPTWLGIAVRVLALTFVGALLSFAVTLLIAILGTATVSLLRRVHPDMRIAYRYIALPMALITALVLSVLATASEIRHFRQGKALKAIARLS